MTCKNTGKNKGLRRLLSGAATKVRSCRLLQQAIVARGCLAGCEAIKQAVNIPVLVAGRVVDPADGEKLLQDGCADFISVGRALYADPHWSAKAFGEVRAPIRKCIACNVCFERLTLEKDVACVHNP